MPLVLRFSSAAGAHLYETPLAADQTITVADDGRLQVVATVQQTQQLSWWLMGFGESVEVLAPPQLRETMRRTAAGLAARYAAADSSPPVQP